MNKKTKVKSSLSSAICLSCDGEGKFNISDCCGAEPRGNGDYDSSDFGICPECKEHCQYGVECGRCDGKGMIY